MAPGDLTRDATDEWLVERARAGDPASYGELVRRHQTAALRLAATICGSTEEARDIVQDAFVKGYRSLGRYRGLSEPRSASERSGSVSEPRGASERSGSVSEPRSASERSGAVAPIRSWLLRIVANDAKNAVRSRVRRHGREERYEALQQVSTQGDPVGEEAVGASESADLLGLLARLGEHDREILACRFVVGLSESETAATIGVPAGTVKSRTSRALAKARDLAGGAVDG